ncbi:ligand-binding sensor domain-containing protein [Parenemella sanctibonifatiensis]|nr:hypothetical protein [Parenemella sanctibonifatiensis]
MTAESATPQSGTGPQRVTGPLRTVAMHRGSFTTGARGLQAITVSQGSDSPLSILSADGRRRASLPLPGSTGAWAVRGIGTTAYVGSYYQGLMYAVDTDAETEELTVRELGRPTPETKYVWDFAEVSDGSLIAATYPDASFVRYYPQTDETQTDEFRVLATLGTEDQLYLRAVAVDEDRDLVWGVIGVTPNEVVGVPLDPDVEADPIRIPLGDPTAVAHQIRYAAGRLWVVTNNRLWLIDPDTGSCRELTDPGTDDPVDNPAPNDNDEPLMRVIGGVLSEPFADVDGDLGLWLFDGSALCHLDLATLELTPVVDEPGSILGSTVHEGELWLWVSQTEAGQAVRELWQLDSSGSLQRHPADVAATPPHMLALGEVPDSPDLMVSAGQQGEFGRWDTVSATTPSLARPSQIESWVWDEGKLYLGAYPQAGLAVWDPVEGGVHQFVALHDSHHQSRPICVSVARHDGGRFLYAGTTPGYGLYAGGLTRVRLDDPEHPFEFWSVAGTVHAVRAYGDAVILSTSTEAGTGSRPVEGPGRLLRVRPGGDWRIEAETDLAYSCITALHVQDGQWYALADRTLCRLDPDSLELTPVVQFEGEGPAPRRGQLIGLPGQGRLLARVGGSAYAVDLAGASTERLMDGVIEVALSQWTDESGAHAVLWGVTAGEQPGAAYTDLLRLEL